MNWKSFIASILYECVPTRIAQNFKISDGPQIKRLSLCEQSHLIYPSVLNFSFALILSVKIRVAVKGTVQRYSCRAHRILTTYLRAVEKPEIENSITALDVEIVYHLKLLEESTFFFLNGA